MDTVTAFHQASEPSEDLAPVVADFAALEQARIFRRLFVTRFGLLAIAAFTATRIIPGLSNYAHWVPIGLFLAPPVWAWVAEIRLGLRLAAAPGRRKKVIKSS